MRCVKSRDTAQTDYRLSESITVKTLRALAATLAAALALAGCSAADRPDGEDNVLTYLEPQFFRTLYPPAAGFYPNGGVVNQLTDRLLYQDPETLELSPWIATEMPKVNADATEYTFTIRTDVTYSDGSPLTAENVVANFDLFGRGDKSRTLTSSEQIANYDRGEVVDEDTVKFYFTQPSPGFLQATSAYNAGLLSDSTLALDNEGFGPGNAVNVIGSGPFVVESEEIGTDLKLKTREDYDWAPPAVKHQGRADIDGVHYILAAEESVRTGAILSGQADIARQISAPQESLLKEQGVDIVSSGTNSMNNQFAFRFDHPLLQDKRVREAIIHGVDREEILRVLFSESYPLATSTVAKTGLAYKDQSAAYTFDPEESKRLLDEAGWEAGPDGIRVKDGQRLVLRTNTALPQPRSKEVMTMVQDQLGELGIGIRVNAGDQATQNADAKDVDKVQIYHSMVGRADYDVITSLYGINNRDAFLNQDAEGNPIDEHLQGLLDAVLDTPDKEGRIKATEEVQDYITEQAYVLPLFEEPVVYAVRPGITGFSPESVARPWFYEVSIDAASNEEEK
ncbi:TIGR04028 family ABC transporter substrate-binding protein [Corynebacterium aurimucosum]|uniref:ABC transport system, solute-binding protein n=1 Tax=Corynebacterium aurimucosum (strain ATCC 700975 / DSM 44827 / CIP 107346 / CN-1) TaxID=548476 RepID=C3PII2_CORA7|nr:TIGR04028 family ABC transporter substrate-binding protein [Corynebacterium aurimucosum]ACP33636.1 ABC transport system, solute-binding protein [Corynebacterium aurimucosum ATCC 700975]QQU92248.1 TIGR04028 family ABC transporter substrate-binding protein [Corynebacterium aurimucosum]